MQHADAVGMMASEKYLLDELTLEQREQFEEHFFSCTECAFDMRAGAAMIEHSKTALAQPFLVPERPPVAVRPAGWMKWLRPSIAVPVFAMLLLTVGYLNFSPLSKSRSATGKLSLPEILPSASLVNARGDQIPVVHAAPEESFLLFVDIPAESRFASYVCELRSPAGALVWSIPVSSDAAKNTLPLHVPGTQLAAGTYNLVAEGVVADPSQSKVALARYSFELAQK
jgi:hypothetical protein